MDRSRTLPLDERALDWLDQMLHLGDGEMYAWLDTEAGEVVTASSMYDLEGEEDPLVFGKGARELPAWQEEERARVEAILAAPRGRYLEIPVGLHGHEPGVLSAFARTLTDPALRDAVYDAMRGRGAFRRVKDLLARHDALDLWRRFEEAHRRANTLAWLEDNDIRLA